MEVMLASEIAEDDPVWRFLQEESTNETTPEPVPDQNAITYNDGEVLKTTVIVYGGILLLILLFFCWVRQRFPNVYNLRQYVEPIKTPLADDQFGFFSWILGVHMMTDEELMDECGMDALCFIRLATMGYNLA